MLHGVVLSPDYDGPCGTPFVASLSASNWQTKAGELRGIWPGNSSLLSQPKRVGGQEVTVPREGWTIDGWMDGWMELGKERVWKIDGWPLSQTLRGHLDYSYCRCLMMSIKLVDLLQKVFSLYNGSIMDKETGDTSF